MQGPAKMQRVSNAFRQVGPFGHWQAERDAALETGLQCLSAGRSLRTLPLEDAHFNRVGERFLRNRPGKRIGSVGRVVPGNPKNGRNLLILNLSRAFRNLARFLKTP